MKVSICEKVWPSMTFEFMRHFMRSGHLHNATIQVKKYVFLNVFFNIFLKTRFKHVYKKKVDSKP